MSTGKDSHACALAEVLDGLNAAQKKISPKYFYDERGSRLFDEICELPEYYLTRTEIAIMRDSAHEMAEEIGPQANIVEFGIGSGLKTKLLLEALDRPASFAPVDISEKHLEETVNALADEFPEIEMLPVAADFTQPFSLPQSRVHSERNAIYFPGSTIGNFEPATALQLLQLMRRQAGNDGCLLIGIDLKKDMQVLENAYNDSQGITAEFNLNTLHHLNSAFDADFNTDEFLHRAFYNDAGGRVEMHLVSQAEQVVHIADQLIRFHAGEAVITEYSHKYRIEDFQEMCLQAGFSVERAWIDSREWFAILYCTALT